MFIQDGRSLRKKLIPDIVGLAEDPATKAKTVARTKHGWKAMVVPSKKDFFAVFRSPPAKEKLTLANLTYETIGSFVELTIPAVGVREVKPARDP